MEDSLGKVRDTEYRDASSRTLRLFEAYEVPVRAWQLQRWDRIEIETLPEIHIEGGRSGVHDDSATYVRRPERVFYQKKLDHRRYPNVRCTIST